MQDSKVVEANRMYHEAQSQMEFLPNYYAWTYDYFAKYITGQVIELGCGAGMGISTYIGRVDRVYAVDHNEQLLRRVKTRLPDHRVVTIQADLRGDWAELRGLRADTMILMDVLEHFADDADFLRNAKALLVPGGHLAIKVPAQSAAYSEMDRASGHFRRYDPERILALAKGLELTVVEMRHINRIGGIAYRFRSQRPTNFSRTFSPAQLKAINLALPLVRMVDLLPGLPGLSLGVVLRRSA
jgi:SAM-dependent methyltransferase